MTYQDFLKTKIAVAPVSGFDVDLSVLNQHAFKWQKYVVKWSIRGFWGMNEMGQN